MDDIPENGPQIRTSDFHYQLPESRIAVRPAEKRDEARLLVFKHGKITHDKFYKIPEYLPEKSALVFNDTRVIPARIEFSKLTGARIELFCLQPDYDMQVAFGVTGQTIWKCLVGNLKKWNPGQALTKRITTGKKVCELTAEISIREKDHCKIKFSWEPADLSWGEVLEAAGETPLPPYIHRKADNFDKSRYQTVYARHKGAVAAPTAGLHFSRATMEALEKKGIPHTNITLHAGAGTFRPVSTENPYNHPIHRELLTVNKSTLNFLKKHSGNLVMTGTTSLRAVESLYWCGVYLSENPSGNIPIELNPSFVWENSNSKLPSSETALDTVLNFMEKNSLSELQVKTGLFILPGYRFKQTGGLITNFHLPESTLLMLVAAFTGENWKKIYWEALNRNYRFLSYGDSSLLIP